MKTDLFHSCGHCWVFQICWPIECSALTASSFRTWNSSAGIPSPPLANGYRFPTGDGNGLELDRGDGCNNTEYINATELDTLKWSKWWVLYCVYFKTIKIIILPWSFFLKHLKVDGRYAKHHQQIRKGSSDSLTHVDCTLSRSEMARCMSWLALVALSWASQECLAELHMACPWLLAGRMLTYPQSAGHCGHWSAWLFGGESLAGYQPTVHSDLWDLPFSSWKHLHLPVRE